MGNRLSKIVTRTGDAGTTGLTGGERVAKTHARVQALGDVDELNSQAGVLLALKVPPAIRQTLTRVQHELFSLGGELSMPGTALMAEAHLLALEAEIEALNRTLPPLKDFVLPGGTAAAAAAHLARAICRRAERAVWAVYEAEKTNLSPLAPRYLNRLSDYLFVAARVLARARGRAEAQWRGTGRRKK
jgi:cob(I)alamin adenosyltransferase